MQPEAAKLLWDARDGADRIARFIAGRDLDDYLGDDRMDVSAPRAQVVADASSGAGAFDITAVMSIGTPSRTERRHRDLGRKAFHSYWASIMAAATDSERQ